MNRIYLLLSLIVVLGITACETEIQPIADYKDITVVYGLLNPNETDHYIKITKAFSGEGNANDLAANAANFNYAASDLSVKIDEYDASNVFKRSFTLNRTVNEIPKDNGVFSTSDNVLYKFSEPNLKKDYFYKLNIYNSALDKEITSKTTIVNDPTMASQGELNSIKLANINGDNLTHAFSVQPHLNSGRVKVYFIFNYTEHYTDTNITPLDKQVRISLGEQKTTSTEGGEVLIYTLEGSNFFSALVNNIPATAPNLQSRRINNATLEIITAGTDLSTYISVNEPSTSVNQNKPEFTNLTNGLGVFSSRSTKNYTPTNHNSFGFGTNGNLNYDSYTLKKLLAMGLEFCNPFNYQPLLPYNYAPHCEDKITNWGTINP